jgi:predicted kinase
MTAAHPQNAAHRPALVVVTGPPGSGKSAIATALRERLGFPLVAKDSLKEVLGEALSIRGRNESQPLGAATFELLAHVVHELLATGVSVIAEGNFTAEAALFVGLPPARILQVHVTAEAALLRTR